MKTITAIALLALACGGAEDGYDAPGSDIGTAQQPIIQAQCGVFGTSEGFGIDMGGITGVQYSPCSRDDANFKCRLPSNPYTFAGQTAALQSGRTSAERSVFVAPAIAAAALMNTFTERSKNPPGSDTPYVFSVNSGPVPYLEVNKGTVQGSINPAFSTIDPRNAFTLVCTSTGNSLVEPYNAGFRLCTHWVATIDYTKIDNYLNARGLDGNAKVKTWSNILRKLALMSQGYGLSTTGGSSMVTNYSISTTANTTAFPPGRFNWLQSYAAGPTDPLNSIQCNAT